MADLGSKLRPVSSGCLSRGRRCGESAWPARRHLKGRQVALGVTDRRLIVQGMNRKFELAGEAISFPPERIAALRPMGPAVAG